MFTRHISRRLAAYLDDQLPLSEIRQAEFHLERCEQCRTERDEIRLGMESLDHLPAVAPPDALWIAIEAAYRERRPQPSPVWRLAFAVAAVVVLLGAAYWMVTRPPSVTDLAAVGKWIETGSASKAVITVGSIGSVEVQPNTRLRVVAARPNEHRLALARGEIRAKISAPPRLFFVDTASGTAIDLGCEYTLTSDEDGSGVLRVTKGWVSFEWKGLESLVPAGAMCRTVAHGGAGVPYFEDAPPALRQAVDGNGSLSVILAAARVRDTLTLWHLLSRVTAGDRELVYDRIAALARVPAGVSREQVMRLDKETLDRWKDELAWTW